MNSETQHIPTFAYELLLVFASIIWAMGTIVIKDAVYVIDPYWLVGLRFTSAGILLSLVLLPRMIKRVDARHIKVGLILGFFVGITYLLNTTGLAYTTAANSSFLTSTYCVFVPFISWALMRKRPTAFNLSAAALCFIGIALVAMPIGGSFTIGLGDALTLASAVSCGLHIVLISKFAPGSDMMVLTALQFLVAGAMAVCWAALNGPPPPLEVFDKEMMGSLVYLVVGATCITLLLQNIGLAHVDPAPGALMLSTESVFGVIFSIWLLGEVLTVQIVVGFVLIFIAVLVSEWLPYVMAERAAKRAASENRDECEVEELDLSS